MAKLAMRQAPAPATPRLFLLSASVWGIVAGALLAVDGGAALRSRWDGPTLALVHAITVGFLGNAMFGSLLQFLPVAADVRVRGGRPAAIALHVLLNLGALLLVAGLRGGLRSPLWGGTLLVAAFVLLAGMLLPGMLVAGSQRFLRWGIGTAVVAAVVAAVLGWALVLARMGRIAVPLARLTDAHAGWGVMGWVLALLAAVARVVMPMFQGVAAIPSRAQGVWQVALYALLLVVLVAALGEASPPGLRVATGLLWLAFALTGLSLQARAPGLRKTPLTFFWMTGFVALAFAACALLDSAAHALLAGVLVLGIGLPLLVVGTQLEITAFLGWIGLQRRCGRGVHLPDVQLLLPVRDKYIVLGAHGIAALALVAAVSRPAFAHVAGLALLSAHAAGLVALCGVGMRARRFVERMPRMETAHG